MTAHGGAPPGKRRGGPHQEAAHTVEVTTTDKPIVTDDPVALARRWRDLRLGCPAGCGDYHECGVGEPAATSCHACGALSVSERESLVTCWDVCPLRRAA